MNRSIFVKLYIGILLLICSLSVYIVLYSSKVIREHYADTLARAIERISLPLLAPVKAHLVDKTPDLRDSTLLQSHFDQELPDDGWTVRVVDTGGRIITPSGIRMDLETDHPEVVRALEGSPGRSILYDESKREHTLSVAMPITGENGVLGVLWVTGPVREITGLQRRIRNRISLIAAAVILLSLFGVLLFMNRLIKPVRILNTAAARAASGDFDARIEIGRNGFLGELAESYHRMTQKVRYYLDDLTAQKAQLDAIISSMQPGLMVLDKEGRISLFNESAEQIIQSDEIRGRYYWEVIREPRLWDVIQAVQESGKNARNDVQMGRGFYQVTTASLPKTRETALVFHDITEMKQLELIKRDFVVNVSHELRTPLTAIKGYAETIDSIDEENRQFLEIIKRHTDRLIKIVEDLLILSELEEAPIIPENEQVQLDDIAGYVIRMFENRFEEKGLSVELDVEPGFPQIRGDNLKFEQIFINLVDNALKYTERGTIGIRLRHFDTIVVVEVSDTGIGIPTQQLSRIFERFYTVDKSRSRRMGGTGLGLSIVKHIVGLHSGTINVRSALGRGTTFEITIPRLPAP